MNPKNVGVLSVNEILDLAHGFGSNTFDSLHMRSSEQEMKRINVTRFDETPGLLGAAAGVALVDQSALAIHEAVEVTAGAREALAEIVCGHLQNFAPHRVTGAEDFTEREDQSLLAIQTKQHPRRATELGFFDQQRHVHRHAIRIRQVEIGRAVDGSAI